MLLGITPKERDQKKLVLQQKGKAVLTLFFVSLFLPVVTYLLFWSGLVGSIPPYDRALEEPVAMVSTALGTGSAFLVGETRLITARHVVDSLQIGETVSLTFSKADPPINTTARLVWKDKAPAKLPEYFVSDVAVLELTSPTDLPEGFPRLLLGDSDAAEIRSEVIVIGYPAGSMSTTTGIISNDEYEGLKLFKLDAGSWGGNSGGPVILEESNEVIGVLVGGMSEEYQGINLSNKINHLLHLWEQEGIDVEE